MTPGELSGRMLEFAVRIGQSVVTAKKRPLQKAAA